MNKFAIVVAAGILVVIIALAIILNRAGMRTSPSTSTENSTTETVGEPSMTANDIREATLTDVTGGSSTGTATIVRKDGQLIHSVIASLPTPRNGYVYEGWLVKEEPELQFISTGVLEEDEGQYTLAVGLYNEYTGYDKVVITLEAEVDETPETHVLEGSF